MIENLPAFIACAVFYAVCGAGLVRYLWMSRTPIAASVHALQIPDIEPTAVWSLSSGGDVGVV